MLALRLTLGSQPVVQLRRLLVAAASAGTGFLLLSALGYAMSHPDSPDGSVLRLAWCLPPLATTVHFAVAVARTDPGTRPRPGLAAIGLSPARLMAVSATTTALSCTLGSMLALLVFLHLRGDLTGMPFDGAASEFLAADSPLPVPATLTLLTLVPAIASATVAFVLRPMELRTAGTGGGGRSYGRFGAYRGSVARETFGAYGRFGAHLRRGERGNTRATGGAGTGGRAMRPTGAHRPQPAGHRRAETVTTHPEQPTNGHGVETAAIESTQPAGSRAAGAAPVPQKGGTTPTRASEHSPTPDPADGPPQTPELTPDFLAPRPAPKGLPWGIAVLAAGLTVESYAGRTTTGALTMPAALPTGPSGVLVGWLLTAVGLALAAPGLTHLCGRLLQAVRPGALRLLAGRVLMEEAARIGRPIGVVCAVASAAYAMATVSDPAATPAFGPLTTLGATVVTGCTVATLLTAALEAKQARADTTAALVRLGAPTTMLRSAAAVRAGALLALFGPLTLIVAELAALPLVR